MPGPLGCFLKASRYISVKAPRYIFMQASGYSLWRHQDYIHIYMHLCEGVRILPWLNQYLKKLQSLFILLLIFYLFTSFLCVPVTVETISEFKDRTDRCIKALSGAESKHSSISAACQLFLRFITLTNMQFEVSTWAFITQTLPAGQLSAWVIILANITCGSRRVLESLFSPKLQAVSGEYLSHRSHQHYM